MAFKHLLVFGVVGALAACSAPTTTGSGGELTQRLAGKTLTNSNSSIVLGADGSMSGTIRGGVPIVGAWTERDGQYCRTITEPERVAGTACQDVAFNDDGTVTFDGINGPVTFAME